MYRPDSRFLRDERGTSVIELVLMVPTLVIGMLMFMALTQSVILRQHALVAARFTGFYHRLTGGQPGGDALRLAVGGRGSWSSTSDGAGGDPDVRSRVTSGDSIVESLFSAVLSGLSSAGTTQSRATHVAAPTVLPRLLQVRTVSARYVLPGGTWTDDKCASYLSHLADALDLGPFNVLAGQ